MCSLVTIRCFCIHVYAELLLQQVPQHRDLALPAIDPCAASDEVEPLRARNGGAEPDLAAGRLFVDDIGAMRRVDDREHSVLNAY